MDNLDIVGILKVGLPGLVFLLSLLSYHLLTKEQEKPSPSEKMLKSIRSFMFINIFLAVLTVAAPLVDQSSAGRNINDIFTVSAVANGDNLGKGNAAVCSNAPYVNRNLLVKDIGTGKAIQVFAKSVIPCTSDIHISLSPEDAINLGWANGSSSSPVELVPAAPGQMFVL